jgi:hypothetical protein
VLFLGTEMNESFRFVAGNGCLWSVETEMEGGKIVFHRVNRIFCDFLSNPVMPAP